MNKATKKVRALTKSSANNRKKSTGPSNQPVTKKKAANHAAASKSSSARTTAKVTTKTGKTGNGIKPSQKGKLPVKTKVSTSKKLSDKRKNHKISDAEYAVFVKKAANTDQVSPEDLVTVDRRATPSTTIENQTEPKVLVDKSDRRQKIQRRRQIDPTTCERDYSQEEIEFMNALDEYKRNSGRMFPTCSEILEVFRNLGYTKPSEEESIEIFVPPEYDNVYATVTETDTMHRSEEQPVSVNSQESHWTIF